ncbi:hypothetical protein C8J57DRAFT_1470375 [Mycena rebaudengoi]|nr:hypothetical protein C8J57DRAFT_1470375 [Mycena rebaudengoi]
MPKQSAAHPPLCLLPSLSQSHTLESALQAPEPPFRLPQASLRRDLHSPPLRANFTYHSHPRPYPATRDPTYAAYPSVFQRPAMRTHGVLIRSPPPFVLRPNEIRYSFKNNHPIRGDLVLMQFSSQISSKSQQPATTTPTNRRVSCIDSRPANLIAPPVKAFNTRRKSSAPHDALSGFDVVVFAEAAVNLHASKSRTYDLTCKIQQFKWPLVFPPRNYDLACMAVTLPAFKISSLHVNSDVKNPLPRANHVADSRNSDILSFKPRYITDGLAV